MNENILQHKKVLVVEDNIINQMVVKHSLLKLGAATEIAGDGEEALMKLKEGDFDLILMDIQMPIMDGYETAQFIRNQLNSNIPIIAMTAFALKGEDERCFVSGMNGYVSKPFNVESLHLAINKVFEFPTVINSNPNILSNSNVSVDISMLYEIAANDDAYIVNMIETFLENMLITIEKLETAYINYDWDNVYKLAHYAKSSLTVIKVADMFEWISALEIKAKDKTDLPAIKILIDKIKNTFLVVEQLMTDKFGNKINSALV